MDRYKLEIVNNHGDRYIRCDPAPDGSWVMFRDVAALQKRVAELEEKLDAAGRVLHKAGEQFSEYATQFAAHKTAVSDLKAAANKQWAERCFSAYWRAAEGGKDE